MPVRLVHGGASYSDLPRMILGNARIPEKVRGDLMTQRNANNAAAPASPGPDSPPQNAISSISIIAAFPDRIATSSEPACGRMRSMKNRAVVSFAL